MLQKHYPVPDKALLKLAKLTFMGKLYEINGTSNLEQNCLTYIMNNTLPYMLPHVTTHVTIRIP